LVDEALVMRFVKRRDPSARLPIKPEGNNLFDHATRDWRERLRALNAAQQAEQSKDDGSLSKQDRP
jgi:hypothetical protein